MSMFKVDFSPTDRQLRQFGFIGMVALPLVGWLFTKEGWNAGNLKTIGILGGIGVVLGAMATINPRSLKWLFVGASIVTIPIGMVVGEVFLLFVYYLMFVPFGLFFKLIGRDPLNRKLQKQVATYWVPKRQPPSTERYFRQS